MSNAFLLNLRIVISVWFLPYNIEVMTIKSQYWSFLISLCEKSKQTSSSKFRCCTCTVCFLASRASPWLLELVTIPWSCFLPLLAISCTMSKRPLEVVSGPSRATQVHQFASTAGQNGTSSNGSSDIPLRPWKGPRWTVTWRRVVVKTKRAKGPRVCFPIDQKSCCWPKKKKVLWAFHGRKKKRD